MKNLANELNAVAVKFHDENDNYSEAIQEYTVISEKMKAEYKEVKSDIHGEKIQPSELKIGDVISDYGFNAEIIDIKTVNSWNGDSDKLVYCIHTKYISGDLGMFKTLCGSALNGCARSPYAYHQGNDLASWFKVAV